MKLSVIITANAEKKIDKTLNSVLAQSLMDLEIIVVLAKESYSAEDANAIKEMDPRIVLCESDSSDINKLRNEGLNIAKGEYVLFLNEKDILLDYVLEAICNKATKYNTDVLRFQSVVTDQKGKTYQVPEYLLSELRPGDYHRSVLLERDAFIYKKKVNHDIFTAIYNRDFLNSKNIQLIDNSLAELLFFYETFSQSENVMYCMDRVMLHEGKEEYMNGLNAQATHEEMTEVLAKIEGILEKNEFDEKVILDILTKEYENYLRRCLKSLEMDAPKEELIDVAFQMINTYSGNSRMTLDRFYLMNAKKMIQNYNYVNKAPKKYVLKHKKCNKPKVSVVVPTMNVEDYLNLALGSLSSQKLEECEFIVLNDGSTDNSMVIINEYAALDKRFIVVDKPNSGYGNTMNIGIDMAKGEYLGILEPDDYVPANMFDDLYFICTKNDLDFVKADFIRFAVNEDGSLKEMYNSLTSKKAFYNKVLSTKENKETFTFIMNTWSGIYKLDFLNKNGIRHNETPGASYQDNGFFFQTFVHGERVMFLNRPYYMNRRDNPNSSMFSKKKEFCITEEYRFIKDKLVELGVFEEFKDIYWKKKYGNSRATLRRLQRDIKPDYVKHMYDEFAQAAKSGEITEEILGHQNWAQLTEIIEDPENYCDKIRVSVIIPVYNGEKNIRQCLDSVLIWDEIKLEVIVVDDGSTDNTLEILREYEEKDSRVKVITQENAGAGAARNNGMKYAKGEYLSILDADDFFEPQMLSVAYAKAKMDQADIVVFRSDEYHETDQKFHDIPYTINSNLLPKNRPFTMEDVNYDVFKVFVGWAWDKLFRREFVEENKLTFQEQRTSNDMLFVFSALVKAESIVIQNTVLAHHRKDTDSLSVTREKSWECFYNALVALKKQLIEWNLFEKYERDFVNYAQHFALWNVESICGNAYYKLFEKLQKEWVEELGILNRPEGYFYNQSEQERMSKLMKMTADEYLFDSLDMSKGNLKMEREKIRDMKEKEELRSKAKMLNQEKKLWNISQRDNEKIIEKMQDEFRSSTTWKVGDTILRVPKAIKRSIKR